MRRELMTNWRQPRQMLLALTFVSVFFSLGRFSLDPTAGNRQVTPLTFPSVVPLQGWQLLESRPQAEPITRVHNSWEAVLATHKYRYKQNNQQMEIQMRYVVGTSGELHSYFQNYASIQLHDGQLLQNLRQQQGVGFYSLFVYQRRSHLSACINPRGSSTVTSAQFLANRYTYDRHLRRLVPWLLGKESLPDKRCLWADLSIPLNKESAQTTYPVLTQAWWFWYQWWNPRFPQLRYKE